MLAGNQKGGGGGKKEVIPWTVGMTREKSRKAEEKGRDWGGS